MIRTLLLLALLALGQARASDHADPLFNKKPDAGLTGLFLFPDGDRLVVVLTTYPGLTSKSPLNLAKYRYQLHFDTHSQVNFDDQAQLVRYGGSVALPQDIKADMTITLALNSDLSVKEANYQGFNDEQDIKLWTGLRDDPFIFPKFFGTNVVAMVLSLPLAAFPAGQQDWLVWATSYRNSKQIDHVGRSLRTMNPRLNLLNTLPPSQHLAALEQRFYNPNVFQNFLMKEVQPLFAIRHYDLFPDVMIYSRRRPAGYPNGRRLSDDVAAISCQWGDCLLWELSFADGKDWPRQTVNDKAFLPQFPYLAEPWP
ncbi:DUF4331 family protein, partial [Gallaecimonas xiamenensis]|uniref:DUF4331 family protein n=1 Tax=Gallaecimonas xiamenensis TaxID=1207039 RepID=UPI0004BB8426